MGQFLRNFAIAKFRENRTIATLSFTDVGKSCPSFRIFNVANIYFNTICKNIYSSNILWSSPCTSIRGTFSDHLVPILIYYLDLSYFQNYEMPKLYRGKLAKRDMDYL